MKGKFELEQAEIERLVFWGVDRGLSGNKEAVPGETKVSENKIDAVLLKKLIRARDKQPIKVSSRKAKGRDFQKWICNQIAILLGIEYDQKDDNCLIHSREMGQAGTDIILRGEAGKQFPFAVECKNIESVSLPGIVKQAQANAEAGKEMLIVIKNKAFDEPVAVLHWSAFFKMFSQIRTGNKYFKTGGSGLADIKKGNSKKRSASVIEERERFER